MAVPPTIPTSFVPRPGMNQRSGFDLATGFRVVSIGIVTITLIAAGAIGGYSWYLTGIQKSKDAQVAQAEASIDTSSVQVFVRLRDRLASARTLLDGHIELSQFFNELESVTLAHVRFSTLTITVMPDNSATITLAGTAATFNALASESAVLANNPLIQDAVFSGITIDKTGTVTFALTATVDSSLIVEPNGGNSTPSSLAPTTSTSSPATSSPPTP